MQYPVEYPIRSPFTWRSSVMAVKLYEFYPAAKDESPGMIDSSDENGKKWYITEEALQDYFKLPGKEKPEKALESKA